MMVIAVDGACRRNGKPDCVSAGGVFILHIDEDMNIQQTALKTNYEIASTNQRGELLGMLTALDYVYEAQKPAQIITDSEYIFNTITKEWYKNWMNKGWITASGTPVKNQDIWMEIVNAYQRCTDDGYEVNFYHVKGHAMSFGKVTASKLLAQDDTGRALFDAVYHRINTAYIKDEVRELLLELSIKNNGFAPDEDTMKRFIVMNTVADALATKCVEAADALV